MRRLLLVLTLVICVGQPASEKATAVLERLKAANLFQKSNRITDTTASLTNEDKLEGAVSSANIQSSQQAGVTAKVYRSSIQRNRARQRLVKDCPACNCLTECGEVLIYEPYFRDRDMNKILLGHSNEYLGVLRKHYQCK